MPLSNKEREEWLNRFPKDAQKGFNSNPLLEWIIQSYMQQLLNGVRNGGQNVSTKTNKPKVDKPAPEPVVDDDDDDDGDMFSLFD